MPKDIELVVFDMDGVLVDSTEAHRQAFEELWAACGVSGPPYEEIAGLSTAAAVRSVTASLNPTPEQVDEWVRRKQETAVRRLEHFDPLIPGALPTLEVLEDRGLKLALATGASAARMSRTLKRAGLSDTFRATISADDVTEGKPHSETYDRAIRESDAAPVRSLVVEDSQAGLRAAHAAGAWSVSVHSGLTLAESTFLGSLPGLSDLLEYVAGAGA